MKIKPGDVFTIQTSKGFGFIQYIQSSEDRIDLVRILEPIKLIPEITQVEVDRLERFTIQFLVKIAFTKKLVTRIGEFKIPAKYRIPERTRTKHSVRGEFICWHIVDATTLQRVSRKELSQEDLMLSPTGIFNDTLIINYLESDWRLSDWK